MQDAVRHVLSRGHTIDITTTGRKSGRPRRIEIVFHNIDGRIYITGQPNAERTRAWLLNVDADPRLTIHLKGAVRADVPATARVITDPDERHRILDWVVANAWRSMDLDTMEAYSPLIEVVPEDLAA